MTTTPDPAAPAPAPSGFFPWLRSLGIVRPDGSWAAGVASGFARRIGVDVAIVRGVLILLALFGGFGLLVYGLAWALLPNERGQIATEEALRGNWTSGFTGAIIVAILGFSGGSFPFFSIFPAFGFFDNGFFATLFVLGLIGVIIWALVANSGRKRREAQERAATDPATGAPYAAWPAPGAQPNGAPGYPGSPAAGAWTVPPAPATPAAWSQNAAATEAFPTTPISGPAAPTEQESPVADTPRVPPTPDAESGAASSAERTDTVAFSDGTATEVLASTGTTGTDSTGNTDSTDTAVLGDDAATAVIAGSEATTTAMPAAPAADLPATAASTAATTAYPAAGAPAAYAASAGYSQPGPVPGYAAPAADSGYGYAAPSAGASYGYGGGVPPHGGYAPAAPVTPKPPRPKSTMANLITIGSALVAVGIILGLDRLTDLSGGWGVGAPVVVLCCAAALAVLALGIIIQGLRGRGAVLLSVLAIFGVITVAGTTLSTGSLFHVSQFSSQGISSGSGSIVAGDQRFVPGTVADAESGFTATASDVTVDLSRIADRGTDNVQVSIDVTMSDLEVILPRDATAKIITRSSLSSVDISDDFLQSVSHGAHTTDGSNVILIGSAQPDFIIEITGTASDIDIDTNR